MNFVFVSVNNDKYQLNIYYASILKKNEEN